MILPIFGMYRQCVQCRAEVRLPFPLDWCVDLIKEGEAGGPVEHFLTPHRESCTAEKPEPDPGTSLRVWGGHVALDLKVQAI